LILSLSAAIFISWRSKTEQFVTPRIWLVSISSAVIVAVLVIAVILSKGTTLPAMLYLSIGQYKDFARNWNVPFHVRHLWIAVASAILAIAWAKAPPESMAQRRMSAALNILKLLIAPLWFVGVRLDRQDLMYVITIPFVWLLLVPATGKAARQVPFERLVLCLLSVFAAMYLLPVAGAQLPFSLVLTIPIVCAFLGDVRTIALGVLGWEKTVRAARIAAVILILVTNGFLTRWAIVHYSRLEQLPLNGANWIHANRRDALMYSWITNTLKTSCDANFSMPGVFSLYFWTQTEPPTTLTQSNWIGLLNASQQQQAVKDLSRVERLCIVYSPKLVEFWNRGQDVSASPLARYIEEEFVPLDERYQYTILVRRGRAK
jgi:hypothetical protein